jgi:RNA polymerase sigma-70 factor (ECF subfamily)
MDKKNSIQFSKTLISRLQKEGMSALEYIYQLYRQDFLLFARKYQATDEDILDAYQDAMIALFENVQTGKLTELTSHIKTYIFSIGKYILLNKLKRQSRIVEIEQIPEQLDDFFYKKIELSHRQTILLNALDELGGKCQELLVLFYYRQFSIEAIMHELGYQSTNVVKASKSRCMKKMKLIIEKKWTGNG